MSNIARLPFGDDVAESSPNISEELMALIEAGLNSDFSTIRRVGGRLVSHFAGDDQGKLQGQLARIIRGRRDLNTPKSLPTDGKSRNPLVEELPWPKDPLFVDGRVDGILKRLVAEAKAADLLAAEGLAPQTNLILSGPPGTGKTLAAGHIAARLGVPLLSARLDSLVSSLLGDTAKNIRSLFEFVQDQPCVLLLDEVDAVAKQRDDDRDIGELKRVVNTLLQALDSLGHRNVIIAATNHPHLLDSAVWRRFPYKIDLSLPNEAVRIDLWKYYLKIEGPEHIQALARLSEGLSAADVRTIALGERRAALLEAREINLPAIVDGVVSCRSGGPGILMSDKADTDYWLQLRRDCRERFAMTSKEESLVFGVTVQAALKARKAQSSHRAGKPNGAGKASTSPHHPGKALTA
ncbi:AAA family ATPase [Nitrospirillum pindoramense]|uniref:ATPase family protein associated with various cellular activities (AAA) n=1 Tax=Nitrospirillum amazonense TaxID=28077 RepID=A0A560GSC7_9PROT|nr:ATP-binding protein [Nitrospirillum amazonense]TWB36923.1 ATPase family protein associated with various cellular activities (AAA) [Nitrospirillum amazonense]